MDYDNNGFYCEVPGCGAICNKTQGCKHHPLTDNANSDKEYTPQVVKDLFGYLNKQQNGKWQP